MAGPAPPQAGHTWVGSETSPTLQPSGPRPACAHQPCTCARGPSAKPSLPTLTVCSPFPAQPVNCSSPQRAPGRERRLPS